MVPYTSSTSVLSWRLHSSLDGILYQFNNSMYVNGGAPCQFNGSDGVCSQHFLNIIPNKKHPSMHYEMDEIRGKHYIKTIEKNL